MRVLEWLSEVRGLPEAIRVDNGPEFISKALDEWAYRNSVKLDFIRPGKPVENCYVESFNGKLREECLNKNYFVSLKEAKELIENWRVEYNTYRPHSSLNDLTPEEFARRLQTKTPRTLLNSGLKRGYGQQLHLFRHKDLPEISTILRCYIATHFKK